MTFTQGIEKDWTTAAGLRAVVLMTSMGHRCGYVAVPAGHPLHGVGYSESTSALSFPAEEEVGKRGAITILCAAADESERTSPDIVFDVHGSLTYSGDGKGKYPAEHEGLWWFGYDCAHYGDARSEEFLASKPEKDRWLYESHDGVHRTLDYCVDECESLARQIVEKTKVSA